MTSPSQQQPEASSKAGRGPQYPAISLRESVQKVQTMWAIEKRNSVPFNVLASHWGYSPKSSGARGTVAALARFGLVDAAGGDYKLTNRALQILLAEGAEKATGLREAALAPKVYRDLWERYGTNLPSDQSLTHKLVLEGFNAASIPDLIKDWKDTIEFAGLKSGDTVDGEPQEALEASVSQPQRDLKLTLRTVPDLRKPAPPPAMSPSVRYLPVPLMIGDAHIPMGMTPKDFDLLLQSLQLWRPSIVAAPEQPAAPVGDTPQDGE